jgi:hypothetical protein
VPGPGEIADRIVDGSLAPAAEAAVRRVLFGPDARGTLEQLYAAGAAGSAAPPDGLKGFFADPARRAAAARCFRGLAKAAVLPAAALIALWRRLRGSA